MKIEMTGYAAMRADVRTVDDLRQLVKTLDENKVRGDANVDWGLGHVYVNVAETAKATWIECGDHLPGDERWDVLLETHHHPEYEEEEDETIICDLCGISEEHDDFGFAATWIFNSKKRDYDTLCEPCAEGYKSGFEDIPEYDWPTKDRLKR